jgi:hypothetical protein
MLGPGHPSTLASRSNLASLPGAMGRLHQAGAGHRVLASIRAEAPGPAHPASLSSRIDLAPKQTPNFEAGFSFRAGDAAIPNAGT